MCPPLFVVHQTQVVYVGCTEISGLQMGRCVGWTPISISGVMCVCVCVGVLLVFLFGIECFAAIIEYIYILLYRCIYFTYGHNICLYTRVYIYRLFDWNARNLLLEHCEARSTKSTWDEESRSRLCQLFRSGSLESHPMKVSISMQHY